MSRAGTKSNQEDDYQHLVALHWLIRLINDEDGISYTQTESTGLPGIDEKISVDDVVVVYADGRCHHIQAKKISRKIASGYLLPMRTLPYWYLSPF